MTDSLHVRRYEPADRNALWYVHDRAFRASPVEFVPDVDRYLRRVPEAFLADGEFLVGTLPTAEAGPTPYDPGDERVVACGGFQPRDDRTAKLRSVRVDPAVQRRGYGRTLVTALEDRAREQGYERVTLTTSEDLRAARGLYESLGYERTGREYVPAFDGYEVAYRREL